MFNEAAMGPAEELQHVKMQNIESARTVFFYQRKDADGDVIAESEVFACYEQEAGLYGKHHKLIAVGDGQAYRKTLIDSGIKPGQVITAAAGRDLLHLAFANELAAAKLSGNRRRPNYQNVHFDDTILRHKNGKQIMDGFVPPG